MFISIWSRRFPTPFLEFIAEHLRIEVLVEPRQLGSKPLAPSLLNAFAAILSTLQGAFERHALQKPSDDTITAGVRTKLVQLADTIRLDQCPRPYGEQRDLHLVAGCVGAGESTACSNC